MKTKCLSKIVIACAGILWSLTPTLAADGDLDTTFGTNGVARAIDAGLSQAVDVAIQSDDKIVVAAAKNHDFAVLRYNADGTPDMSFGIAGEVTIDFPDGSISNVRDDVPTTLGIQSDGKIVVAGSTSGGVFIPVFDFALARLNPDGSLDTSFGSGGRVQTDFSNRTDVVNDVAIKSNGKIIAVGSTSTGNNSKFALARYLDDGSLDQNFGNAGEVTLGWGGGTNVAKSVAIQSDSKIVVGGYEFEDCGGNNVGYFALARLRTNGSLDPAFGVGGKKKTKFAPCSQSPKGAAVAVAIQTDGNILASGIPLLFGSSWGIVRYHGADGSLDTSFGTGGKVTIQTADNGSSLGGPRAMAVDNGKIILAGYGASYCNPFGSANHAMLLRLQSNGEPDAAFGHDAPGVVLFSPYSFTCPANVAYGAGFKANGFALQSDGKIVIAGLDDKGDTSSRLALARFFN